MAVAILSSTPAACQASSCIPACVRRYSPRVFPARFPVILRVGNTAKVATAAPGRSVVISWRNPLATTSPPILDPPKCSHRPSTSFPSVFPRNHHQPPPSDISVRSKGTPHNFSPNTRPAQMFPPSIHLLSIYLLSICFPHAVTINPHPPIFQ
jgi:hypothetical protein